MAARRNHDRDSGINDPGDETLDNPDRLNTIDEDPVSSDDDHEENEPEDSPLHTPPEDVPDPNEMANPAPATGGTLWTIVCCPPF